MAPSLLALALCLPAAPMNPPAVEIVAHRGASFDAPENTVAAIKLAWEQRADAVEFDVYLSKDGKVVVLHDKDLKRTGGVDKLVADMTADELRKIDVGSWKGKKFAGEPVPTLEDVLATIPEGKRVFIEVKCGPEIVPELDRVLSASKRKPEQTAVISFSAPVIAAVKKARPDLQGYWIVSIKPTKDKPAPTAAGLIARAKEIGADGLDLSAMVDVLTADYAKAVNAAGLKLYVWTVNDAAVARTMIERGVEGITTDRPGWLREQLAAPAAAARPLTLRVLSYNIHHGEGTDGKVDLTRLAKFIADQKPDLVALQEVDKRTKRTLQVDQLAELMKLTRMYGAFGKSLDYEGGDYGQAILSRFPLGETKVHWLPGEPPREKRIVFTAQLTFDGRPMTFATTHLHHQDEPTRVAQAKELNELFGELQTTILLAGDLNAVPASKPLEILSAKWKTAPEGPAMLTYPSQKPRTQLDYVLVRPAGKFRVVEQKVLGEEVISDHRPVLVVLELRD